MVAISSPGYAHSFVPSFELVKAPACALGPAPFVPYSLGSKKKKKKGVATKGSVETVPQQACAEQAVASEWPART